MPGCLRSRATSCGGGSRIRSTLPAISAETRVGSDLIERKLTSVTLPSGFPHQFGLRTITVFTSGSRDFSMYGPVPLACSEAYDSSLAE